MIGIECMIFKLVKTKTIEKTFKQQQQNVSITTTATTTITIQARVTEALTKGTEL